MKTVLLMLLSAAAMSTLACCASAPKQPDPFEAAIDAGVGVMAGGIMGMNVNAGGGR